jgi:cytochrome c-type biogenesis protein CcmH/NrfF
MLIAWSVAVWLIAGLQPAVAAAPAAQAPALAVALEQEARQIERMLIAPCCWNQPVSEHASPASDEVKAQIREWLGRGMTREQVLDAFVERYGARILAEPPNKGVGRFLYLGPWVVLGLSAVGLVVLVRKLTGTRGPVPAAAEPAPAAPAPDSASRSYEERLDDELRDLD